jgi:hypothetical protein
MMLLENDLTPECRTAMESAMAELKVAIEHAEMKATRAEERSADAAAIALGAVESVRHFQNALESGHAQMGEMLVAQRKMVNIVELLAKSVLESKKG